MPDESVEVSSVCEPVSVTGAPATGAPPASVRRPEIPCVVTPEVSVKLAVWSALRFENVCAGGVSEEPAFDAPTVKLPPGGRLANWKVPSSPVSCVALTEPVRLTFTPATGALPASVTTPLIEGATVSFETKTSRPERL